MIHLSNDSSKQVPLITNYNKGTREQTNEEIAQNNEIVNSTSNNNRSLELSAVNEFQLSDENIIEVVNPNLKRHREDSPDRPSKVI